MDIKEKVKILVQQVVEAYIKEQLKINKEKSITILLGYQSPNPSEVLKAITPLLVHYDVTILLSKEWLPVPEPLTRTTYLLIEDTSQAELMEIVEKTSLLVVPAASYRLLSKLALTMDDEVAVWLAIQYQLLGKPIVIANNYVEPTVYQQIHAPYSVQERLQTYIRQIRTDQVNWIPLSKLNQNVAHQLQAFETKKSLILEKHIEQAQREGLTKISLPQKSQVTPAAKDLAREYRIQIKQSSKGG
ncbi:MAG: hypothetical protein AB2392_05735 [Neobacillus sp.]